MSLVPLISVRQELMMFEKAGIYIQIHTTMTSTTMIIAVQWHTIEKYISNQNKIIKVHLHIKLH